MVDGNRFQGEWESEGTAMANYDDFLGYVLGTAIACAAVLLAIGDVAPQRGVSHIDIALTGKTTAK
jgi:hypothetical protein